MYYIPDEQSRVENHYNIITEDTMYQIEDTQLMRGIATGETTSTVRISYSEEQFKTIYANNFITLLLDWSCTGLPSRL